MKKNIKKIFAVVLAMLVVFILPACTQNDQKGGLVQDKSNELYIYVTFEKGSEYFNWVYAGFLDAATELGVKAEMHGPADADASQQAKVLDTVTGKNPNGILVACADEDTLVPSINNTLAEGIPVITCDSDSPSSDRLLYLGTDNSSFGAIAADYIADKLGGKGEVIMLTLFGSAAQDERKDGFEDRLKEKYPDIKVVDVCNESGDVAISESNVTASLQAHPNVKAIFSTGGTGSSGVAAAVRTVGKTGSIVVVGSDFGSAVLELLENNEISATVVDDPYMMGYQSMLQLFAAAHPTDIISTNAPYGHIPTNDIHFACSLLTAEEYRSNKAIQDRYKNIPVF